MFEESVSSLPSIWASMNSWLTPTVLFVLLNLMIGTIAIASSLGTQTHQDQDKDQNQNQQQQHHQQHRELARSPSMLQRLKSINLYSYRSPEPAANYEKAPESETAHFFSFQHQTGHEIQQPQLARSPSMLQRLKSISSYFPREYSTPVKSRDVAPEPEAQSQAQAEAHYGAFDHASHEEDEEEEDNEYPEEMEDHFEMDLPATPEPEPEPEQTLDEIYSQLHLHDHQVSRTTSDTKPASGEVPSKLPKKMKKSASAKSAFAHFDANDILETRRPATVREKKAKKVTEDEEVDAKADDFINRFKNQLKLQRIDSIIRYKDMINRGSGK